MSEIDDVALHNGDGERVSGGGLVLQSCCKVAGAGVGRRLRSLKGVGQGIREGWKPCASPSAKAAFLIGMPSRNRSSALTLSAGHGDGGEEWFW